MAVRVLASIILLSTSLSASAYYIWGTGEDSCSEYIGAIGEYRHRGNPTDHRAHINWIKGFITGINWAKDSDVAKDLDEEAVANWVDGYCRENLSSTVAEAAAALVTAYEK